MGRLALHWQILIGMLAGALIGLTLNFTVSHSQRTLSPEQLPTGIVAAEILDTPDRIEVHLTRSIARDGEADDVQNEVYIVDGTSDEKGALPTVRELKDQHPEVYNLFVEHGRSTSRWLGDLAEQLGGLFLRLLRMVAIPLIVTSLVTGVLSLGHASRLGSMFGRTIGYYLCTSMLAIFVGLTMVNLIRPGLGDGVVAGAGATKPPSGDIGQVLFDQVKKMIPTNPFQALAEAEFLSVISFSLAFAIFAVLVGGKPAEQLRGLVQAAFEVMMAMTMAIIKLAPVGVLFLMMYVTATQGQKVFVSLFWYMLTVLSALIIHAVIVLPLILKFVARRSPIEFAKAMSPALLTAFSSASSNGTLPLTLASVEQRGKVSNRVSSFVLPLGATINMDGTALYEAVAVLFIAQLHYQSNMPLTGQLIVALTALLASIGAAGIPHAGLVMMVIILEAVGLPVEMQGIIIAVDRVLDMGRTSVNVWSDSCGCAVVARFETGVHEDAPPLELPSEPT